MRNHELFMGKVGKRMVSIHTEDLANGHIVGFGLSGYGKTNQFKNLIVQEARNQVVVIPDTSDSFDCFIGLDEVKVTVIDIYEEGIGLEPFATVWFDEDHQEKCAGAANRVATVMQSIYGLGGTQYSFLYKAIKTAIMADGDTNARWNTVLNTLRAIEDESARKLCVKLEYLIDLEIFSDRKDFLPDSFCGSGIILIKMRHFSALEKRLILELLLWEIWRIFQENHGDGQQVTLMLDECQTLNFSEVSPISKILTEGRKFGIRCWLATQFLKGNFNPAAISRLEQSAVRLYFRPVESDIRHILDVLGSKDKKVWAEKLRRLEIGEFVLSGYFRLGGLGKANDPIIVKAEKFKIDET